MAVRVLLFTLLGFCSLIGHGLQRSVPDTEPDRRWHRWHRHRRTHTTETTTVEPAIPQIPADVPILPASNDMHDGQCNWAGLNSYFLYALDEGDQIKVLRDMQQWGLKILRIFVTTVPKHFKGSSSVFVNFMEPDFMGPPYNLTALKLINSLMVRAHDHGVKLAIAMHDRYSLGCWSCDGYQKALGLTCIQDLKNKTCRPLNDASEFYRNATAVEFYEKRLEFILNFQNPHFNKRWGDLTEVVAMFEVQNEAQGLDPHPWVANWTCGRASFMRPLVHSDILIGTGGGRTFAESNLLEHFHCEAIDVVNIHDYSASTWDEMNDNLTFSKFLSQYHSKKVVYEEFGLEDRYHRPDYYYAIVTAANRNGIPFMPWQYLYPPNTNNKDYEFDDHQAAYPVLVFGVLMANRTAAIQNWANLDLCNITD